MGSPAENAPVYRCCTVIVTGSTAIAVQRSHNLISLLRRQSRPSQDSLHRWQSQIVELKSMPQGCYCP